MSTPTHCGASHDVLLSQAARLGWVNNASIFPRSTFDCPSLCRLSALFQEGHSPTLEEIRPLIAAKFAAGRVTVQDLVQIALDFLAPKYKQGLTQETIEEVIGKTPATPEILRMALAVQILDEAWRSDFFDWYNVTRN